MYGSSGVAIAFDDRALAHLQVVIGSKLRRHEPFFFAWADGVEKGSGRSAIWIDEAIAIRFVYSNSVRPALNRDWVELLGNSANSSTGLLFTAEPGAPIPPAVVEITPGPSARRNASGNRTVPV